MDDDEAGMLAPIEGALPKIKPLTPVQRRRLESADAIADGLSEGITFQHTVLCQTCMPYRDPGDSTRVWERQQGMISLRIEAGSVRDPTAHEYVDIGLPFGAKPRLILAHLNREALRQGSPRIEVENSLTAFIRRVTNYNSVNAREIGLFRHQLARFAAAGVRMAVDRPGRAYQINTHIIDAFDLWPGKDERQHVLWPAEVELSPRYFESLTNHAVPLDERALRALANSPMALDVYAWLAQRLHRVDPRRPQFITWAAIYEQFGVGYTRIRAFREHFRGTMNQVLSQYPAARVEDDGRGITLRHSPPPVKGRMVAVQSKPAERLSPATAEPLRQPTVEGFAPPPVDTGYIPPGRTAELLYTFPDIGTVLFKPAPDMPPDQLRALNDVLRQMLRQVEEKGVPLFVPDDGGPKQKTG